jgi:hypothetical protein
VNNEDRKVYEIVNQYYYDIESSKIYFGTFRIWKLRQGRLWSYLALIICAFLSVSSIFIIILDAMNLLEAGSNTYILASNYTIWVIYILSLLLYVGCYIYIEEKKFNILKSKYNKEKLVDIQQIWIKENLPSNINKKILIDKIVDWENTHRLLLFYSNEFHTTGKILQSSHFNAFFKVILSVLPVLISVNILNGISFEDFSVENPITYLTFVFYAIVVIAMIGFIYSSLKPPFERLLCHIDGNKSKRAYRFNIFNRMLSNHVTIKELSES